MAFMAENMLLLFFFFSGWFHWIAVACTLGAYNSQDSMQDIIIRAEQREVEEGPHYTLNPSLKWWSTAIFPVAIRGKFCVCCPQPFEEVWNKQMICVKSTVSYNMEILEFKSWTGIKQCWNFFFCSGPGWGSVGLRLSLWFALYIHQVLVWRAGYYSLWNW